MNLYDVCILFTENNYITTEIHNAVCVSNFCEETTDAEYPKSVNPYRRIK
jgi:hypothetical protein